MCYPHHMVILVSSCSPHKEDSADDTYGVCGEPVNHPFRTMCGDSDQLSACLSLWLHRCFLTSKTLGRGTPLPQRSSETHPVACLPKLNSPLGASCVESRASRTVLMWYLQYMLGRNKGLFSAFPPVAHGDHERILYISCCFRTRVLMKTKNGGKSSKCHPPEPGTCVCHPGVSMGGTDGTLPLH